MPRKAARKLGRPPRAAGPDSRSLILEAALELFSSQGYEATSVKQIAAKLGFRDSALYGHFASKAAIRAELFTHFGPIAVRQEWANLDLSNVWHNPKAFIKDQLHELATRWLDPRERQFFRLLLMENLRTDTEPLIRIGQLSAQLRTNLTQIASRLIDSGLLRKVDPDWLVGQFVAPILTMRIEVAFGVSQAPLNELMARLDHHVDLFFATFSKA